MSSRRRRRNSRPTSDWTCRVLVGGLKPAREYWYRFTDARWQRQPHRPHDHRARGRRSARGALRLRLLPERQPRRAERVPAHDLRRRARRTGRSPRLRAASRRLHLRTRLVSGGSSAGHVRPPHPRHRALSARREASRISTSRPRSTTTAPSIAPISHDPDLQDARAYLPFVPMWDNHEFSWLGWQSLQTFDGKTLPRQTRKVAAMQAWFEYQPARVTKPSPSLERFDAPHVVDAPITRFDDHGLGRSRTICAAIASLTGYRALRWGRHVDLIITDQRSYRSEEPTGDDRADAFSRARIFRTSAAGSAGDSRRRPQLRTAASRRRRSASATRRSPTSARTSPPQTMLGADAEGMVPRATEGVATRPGRSGATPPARSTCAPIRRICRRA